MWNIISASNLTENEKMQMFTMYVNSYTLGGQSLWFQTPKELFDRYSCVATIDNMFLKVYAMFQFRKKYNKISLICHDGSEEGKKLAIYLCLELVKQNGWILEASDKLSWVLRKSDAPIITEYDSITDALDIQNSPTDKIVINTEFDYNEKLHYQYIRFYHDTKNDKIYESKETLFGTGPCNYVNAIDCNRTCGLRAGKRKSRTRKSRKRKSRKSGKTKK